MYVLLLLSIQTNDLEELSTLVRPRRGRSDAHGQDRADLQDCQAKYDAEVELHKRKQIAYTVIRPGTLTSEPAANKGVKMGRTHIGKTRSVSLLPCSCFSLRPGNPA